MNNKRLAFTLRATSGFTLIELLLVIGIIAILAAIVILAINPTLQLTKAEDAKRTSNAREIKSAINQYIIDNGYPPAGLSATEQDICNYSATDTSGCLDLDVLVEEDYLVTLEQDVKETSANNLGYTASQANNGFLTVEPTYIGQSGGAGLIASVAGPRVTAVRVNSTVWASVFRDYVDYDKSVPPQEYNVERLDDGLSAGYVIPSGANQTATLPWRYIDQILLDFSEDVSASLTASDIALVVTPGTLADTSIAPIVAVSSVTWDAPNNRAVINLDQSIPPSVIQVTIDDTAVTNAAGNLLDGEWINGTSSGVSGDGAEGGDYAFEIRVLPGDVDKTSFELVDSNDVDYISARIGSIIFSGLGSDYGDDVGQDVNGTGEVTAGDRGSVQVSSGSSL